MKEKVMTIIIPCYNEVEALDYLIDQLIEVQAEIQGVFIELLFIDDGSSDGTLDKIKALAEYHTNRIDYVSFSRNFGKEAAILAGLERAKGEWVALMDADLQDPPELLPEMHRLIVEEAYDMVGTKRLSRAGEPVVRSFFASLFYKLNNKISAVHLEEGVRDFRLMTQQVVQAVVSLPEYNRFSKGIFNWVGFNVKYLEFDHVERRAGKTSWSFMQLFNYALEGIISFSDLPLTIASMIGFIIFLLAFIYGVYIVIKTLLLGTATPGWPSLAVIILGLGGLQLFCMGIIGKYIAKLFNETKKRPKYIVKEQSESQDE